VLADRLRPRGPRCRRAVADNGTSLRGAIGPDSRPGAPARGVRLHPGTVLALLAVDSTANEIPRFQLLLADLDLAEVVVTADALSRDPHNASYAEVVVMPRWRAVALVWG
jgi:hypothetical protein